MSDLHIAHGASPASAAISKRETVDFKTLCDRTIYRGLRHGRLPFAEYEKAKAAKDRAAGKDKAGPWISFARYSKPIRNAANVESVSALVIDLDACTLMRADIEAALAGRQYVAWSSYSHGCAGLSCWRVVLPYSRPATPDEHRAAARGLGPALFPEQPLDLAAMSDAARLWFLPGCPPDAAERHEYWYCDDGAPLDVDSSIAASAARPEAPATPAEPAVVELGGGQLDDLRAALAHPELRQAAGSYAVWSDIGLALLTLGAQGRELFIEFSKQAAGYEPNAPEEFWSRNVLTDSRSDWRHVLNLASERGWHNPMGAPQTAATADEFPDVPGPEKRRLRVRTALEMLEAPSQMRWLIRDEIERGVLAVMSGPMSTYKSFIALDWALRIATAGEHILLLSAEGGGLDRRISAWFLAYPQAEERDIRGRVHCIEQRCDLGDTAIREALLALGIRPALIVIDTYSKYRGAINEDKASEVGPFIGKLDALRRALAGPTILLITHTGLADQSRARGSSALEYDTDAAYVVAKNQDVATVTRERFKDAPTMPPLAFRPREFDLGYADADGRPVSSLALDRIDAPPPRTLRGKDREPGRYEQAVLKVLDGTLADNLSEAALLDAAAENIVLSGTEKRDRRREYVARAVESLERTGRLVRRDGLIFDTEKSFEEKAA